MNKESLLSVEDLSVRFNVGKASIFSSQQTQVRAVEEASFSLGSGKTLGVVGESGSGKTTMAMATIRLVEAQGGRVFFNSKDLLSLSKEQLRLERKHFQIIFQDPYSSLNPRMRVRDIIKEPLELQGIGDEQERMERVDRLFNEVGLHAEQKNLFPHQFSGGQRQRVAIARALATEPSLVVCDEAVSALDVMIQAQILNLLRRLQEEFSMAYLFISHDLSVIQYLCEDIIVMYLGRIVESASRRQLFREPLHPYTQSLLASVPKLAQRKAQGLRYKSNIVSEIPSPTGMFKGCPFASRCARVEKRCREERPLLRELDSGHKAACHFV